MDPTHYADYHKILNLPDDASLQEIDQRYFEAVEYWTVQDRDGAKHAKLELQRIDEAYGEFLKKHIKEQENTKCPDELNFTMQQVLNGQERITKSSMRDDDLWVPAREERCPSPEFGDGIDLDGMGKDDMDMDMDKIDEYDNMQQSSHKILGIAPGFKIREIEGDVKDAPDRAVIVHAVNCQGVWGYGIAKELKKMVRRLSQIFHVTDGAECPAAYEIYRASCQRADRPSDVIGTCLLIPPQPSDHQQQSKLKLKGVKHSSHPEITIPLPRRWIGCLFTSIGYGKANMKTNNPGKDSPVNIMKYSRLALEDLRLHLEDFCPSNFNKMTRRETDDEKPGEIWSPRFNSGAFAVDWEVTREVVVEEFDGFERPWTVVNKVNGEDYEPDIASQNDAGERGVPRVERAARRRRHSKLEFEDHSEGRNGESESDKPESLRDGLQELDFR